ncbi:hypothetical protein [Nocardia sp. NBC_01329]|uniref:hypothetical protein n=1 Tax=Nocardia sp. NBC_01329 TaxID=2903594 RepID=UPI003FA37442
MTQRGFIGARGDDYLHEPFAQRSRTSGVYLRDLIVDDIDGLTETELYDRAEFPDRLAAP